MAEAPQRRADDAPAATSKRPQKSEAGESELIGRSVTINRPRAELYAFWRDLQNLAAFMENVERIEVLDGLRSRWTVKAPGGGTVEWTSAITEESEEEFIAWASEEGADVGNSGRVEFRDAGDRGTVVSATLLYDPPAGIVGKVIAKLSQREPAIQARRDLRRFKQLMETGEIATGARNRRLMEEGKN